MPNGSCDDLFASWLLARENGEERDIESLAAEHPTCAETLRAQHAELLRLESVLGLSSPPTEAAAGSDPDAPPDPGLILEPPQSGEAETKPAPLLERLTQRGPPRGRFVVKERVGRGGMGAVFRVYDSEIGRHVAAKVLHLDDPAYLPRFLEEAQITGQLDHPAFIPVHDFALDEKGRIFFTMKLVKGITDEQTEEIRAETLSDVIEKIHAGIEDWTLTRGLDVILRVAEAMEFAHVKGVVHRDLKPLNILVGRYGEVYVTDFGIARVQGKERFAASERRSRSEGTLAESPEPAIAAPTPLTLVRTQRRDAIERGRADPPTTANPDSPGPTEEGATIGTAEYMPLEQAEGRLSEIGPRSDIYSLGATLYHLIAGIPPWHTHDDHPHRNLIVQRMISGARPAALHTLAARVPAELLAIVDKAMANPPADRYPSMKDLAVDLRAYLERRVVSAYETGAIAELKKWVQRNPALSAAAATLVLVLAGSTLIVTQQNREVEAKNVALGKANAEISAQKADVEAKNVEILAQKREVENQKREVEERGAEVAQRKAQFDQLAGVVKLEQAKLAEAELYPPWPEKIAAMDAWLGADAKALLDLKPTLAAKLSELEASAIQTGEGESTTFTFADPAQEFLHSTLTQLSRDIARFEATTYAEVKQRLEWARQIGELTLRHPNARVTWDDARSAIAKADDIVASKLYAQSPGGPIDLIPQMGLVPIGMNPITKLWEFYELRSACDVAAGEDPAALEIPTHRENGSIEVKDGTGIVFVLLPGGTFLQGAQKSDPNAPNFDEGAESDEVPREVTLAPYFLARHELTRRQWFCLSNGVEPSTTPRGAAFPHDPKIGWSHPVESMNWTSCHDLFAHHGLTLPTETQWEYGARGGKSTVRWPGDNAASLADTGNVIDVRAHSEFPQWGSQEGDFDDGFVGPSQVGSLRANEFGLFDVLGNMWEWCLDAYASQYSPPQSIDGLRETSATVSAHRVVRGGSFDNPASEARSANRARYPPSFLIYNVGARAARRTISE